MPKFRKASNAPEGSEPTHEEQAQNAAASGGDTEGATETHADESDIERLEREKDELEANWKRALADYKNLRKRTLTDIDAAVRASKQGMLSELLLVLDYLEMALATKCETQEGQNLLFGVQMTRDQMLGFLKSQDVTPIDSSGRFDPELHQANETVVDPEREPGQIVETVRRGFMCGDHVLRYAQVKVVADPSEPTAERDASDSDDPDEAEAQNEI